jgi:preflagellin peptidase FlaK
MDWLPIIRVAICFVVLCLASYSDWRTRMASDAYWAILGGMGLLFLGYQIITAGVDPLYLLFLVPIGWFFFDLLVDRDGLFEGGINVVPVVLYIASVACVGVVLFKFWNQAYFWELASIPLMFLIYYLLYIVDIIKGGADAKSLIAISLLVPVYPIIGPFPLVALPTAMAQYIMPFSLLVLFYGALITLVIPVYYLIYNMVKGDRKFPTMLFGVRMDTEEAKKKFVWPMEYLDGDEVKISSLPRGPESAEEHYAALESKGLTRIWVTPKIPMLIPITAGIVIATILGNVIFTVF